MKKSLLAIGMFMLVAFASQAQSTTPVSSKDSADFKFETEEYNYGTIKQGESVNHDFSFTNIGKEPLIITNAQGSCGCTVPEYPKQPIKKGEKAVIKVTFNSAGKSGMQDKTVTISSNAKSGTKVLHIKGNITVPETAPVAPVPTPAAPPAPQIK